jgi:hypothetical protein
MSSIDYSYIGVGQIYMRDRAGSGGLIPVGNVSALNFAGEEDEVSLRDYTSPGGGTRNEVRRISGLAVSMTMHDLSPENVARAMYGTVGAVASGSASDESVVAYHGALTPLDKPGGSNIVVTSDPAGTTYVEGTDYDVVPAGIIALSTGSIADGASLLVSYDYPAQNVVEALTSSSAEFEMVFDGVNEARSGKPFVVTAHRVRFGVAQSLDMIGDDYAGLELTGKALADSTKGAGQSKYFHAKLVA